MIGSIPDLLPLATITDPIALLRGAYIPLSCKGTDFWRAMWADDCLIVWPNHGRAHNSMPWIYGLDDPQDHDHSDLLDWLMRFSLDRSRPDVARLIAERAP